MAFPRFLVAGVVNTGLTYLLYLGLLLMMPYIWAYSVTYVTGIVLGYVLNAKWVFKKSFGMKSAATYPLSYLLNYLFGVTVLWFLVDVLKLPKEIAPLIVVAMSVPLMYFVTKMIFHGGVHETKANN